MKIWIFRTGVVLWPQSRGCRASGPDPTPPVPPSSRAYQSGRPSLHAAAGTCIWKITQNMNLIIQQSVLVFETQWLKTIKDAHTNFDINYITQKQKYHRTKEILTFLVTTVEKTMSALQDINFWLLLIMQWNWLQKYEELCGVIANMPSSKSRNERTDILISYMQNKIH